MDYLRINFHPDLHYVDRLNQAFLSSMDIKDVYTFVNTYSLIALPNDFY